MSADKSCSNGKLDSTVVISHAPGSSPFVSCQPSCVADSAQDFYDTRQNGCMEDFYEIGQELNVGRFGSVQTCHSKATGVARAVKTVSMAEFRVQEREIMEKLEHPNIIKLYEWFEFCSRVHLILELCTGGDLFDRIIGTYDKSVKELGRFTEEQTAIVMQPMFDVMSYMHKKHISHRDLKLENVACLTDEAIEKTQILLIDFGTACEFADGQHFTIPVGTPKCAAPEVHKGKYDCAADLWGLGIMMYILLCGHRPVFDSSWKFSFAGAVWERVSEDAKKLIRLLLKVDPRERYTAEQALKDAWLDLVFSKTWTSMVHFAISDLVEYKSTVHQEKRQYEDREGICCIKHGQVGRIMEIEEDGTLVIDFDPYEDSKSYEGWSADPADIQTWGLASL